jgi:outer membrane beta-barrel protein
MSRNLLIVSLLAALTAPAYAQDGAPDHKDAWEAWVQRGAAQQDGEIIQNRKIVKQGRFQLMAPVVGVALRGDFHNTTAIALAGRYFFNETHGWEFLRATLTFSSENEVAQQVRENTGFYPDTQKSRRQLSTSYVFSPIYGKYAWGGEKIVYFDIHATLGAGLRFARDRQFFFEASLGSNHYLLGGRFALVPEIRVRTYSEMRTVSTQVFETFLLLGGSWLF